MRNYIFALFILLPVIGLQAQDGVLTPLEVAKIQDVTDVIISDDGKLLAFLRSAPADPLVENKPAAYHLFLHDVTSGETVPFFTRSRVRNVAFRPGANSITFLARLEGDKATSLYEMPLSGGEAVNIFSFSHAISAYEWSADGSRLAFLSGIPSTEEESDLPYQPIVYEENPTYTSAFVLDWGESEPRTVDLPGDVHAIRWSPTGDKLALSVSPTPQVDDYYMKQTVHIIDANTLKSTATVAHVGKKGGFAWSPGGDKLAMIAGADTHDPTDGRLFVVGADGGTPKNLYPDFKGAFDDFAWASNNALQVLVSEGVQSVLGVISAEGGGIKRHYEPKGLVLTSFDRAGDGTLALIGNAPSHPNEAFLMKPAAEKKPRRLTNSNPWLEDETFGRQEAITYEARDGLEIQGLLIYPTDYEAGKKYPLITVVHGGPESHYDNGWLTRYSVPGQMAASQGYFVFYPNYRGSTGRGVEFAMSSQGDLAGKEFDDIVDGVDYLIEQGFIDEDKVGVTGGSYGGYATGWMATRYTDRFAAGVMFVGISDNISKWGTSDIPEELYLVHARKRIWEDYEFFLKRSPIYYAGQAETPLLIMAGAEDTRVDPSQSLELYRHIKTRTDTPVRLVLYPGEGHGNRNATARLDYSRRLMGWFDQYLKKEQARP